MNEQGPGPGCIHVGPIESLAPANPEQHRCRKCYGAVWPGAGRAVQDDGLRRAAENVIRWWDAAPPTFPEGEHVGPAIEGLRSALRAAPPLDDPTGDGL